MLFNLHLLRAFAAIAVVYFHITSEAGLNLRYNIGAHGVDIFFVISGFIISFISAKAPQFFFRRRLIRIVPFYWAATLFVFCIALLFPHLLRSTQADFPQLLCSLFFLPRETSYAGLFPTLILGWSLNYEMYFYVVFAISLAINRRWSPIICIAIITAVLLAINSSGIVHPSIHFYARPIVFEFCLGIATYYMFLLADRHAESLRSARYTVPLLLLIAIGSCVALGFEEFHGSYGLPRFVAAGLPACALVTSALLLEKVCGISSKSNIIYQLGESSYILYLIHPYIIYTILRVAVPHPQNLSVAATATLIVAMVVLSSAIAIAIHHWFEKPAMAYLRSRYAA